MSRSSAAGPVDQLLARGLLVARDRRHVAVPREVAICLRGGFTTRGRVDQMPALTTSERERTLVDRAAAGAAFELVRHVELLLEHWGTAPPSALRTGGLDVLAQHILGCACAAPFFADELYDEMRAAAPYAELSRRDFDDVVDFVATGGYALKTYERFARIKLDQQGRWRVANPAVRQSYRLNVGTIVEEQMLKVRLMRSRHRGGGESLS